MFVGLLRIPAHLLPKYRLRYSAQDRDGNVELQLSPEEVEDYSATLAVISRLIKDEHTAEQDTGKDFVAEVQLLDSWPKDLGLIVSSLGDALCRADPMAIPRCLAPKMSTKTMP